MHTALVTYHDSVITARCLELKFERIFHLWLIIVKFWWFKDGHFGQFGTMNARYLIRPRNHSKFVIIDLLKGAKSIIL